MADAAHRARLDRVARMSEPSPWPERPEPPPKPEPWYHGERYGDSYVVAHEGTDLLAVAVYCMGAHELTPRMEARKRDKTNLRHNNLRLPPAPSLNHYGCAHIECSTRIAALRQREAFAI